jgi:hypothetical protein
MNQQIRIQIPKILKFENVKTKPLSQRRRIIKDRDIRIRDDSCFDSENHIFRSSVKGTVFQKDINDTSYYHRNTEYNNYYKNLMDFSNGDEILQVGYASIPAAIRHAVFNNMKKFIPQ